MSAKAAVRRPSATEQAARGWRPGPHEPSLEEGTLDVWHADLDSVGEQILAPLSAAERRRASRILGARAGLRWARSRGLLRALLGRYLGGDPRELSLDVGPHGKLELGGVEQARGRLSFNLSHCENIALFAFTTIGPVGVDVQLARATSAERSASADGREHVALARRLFDEQQARRLAALGAPQREVEFLRLWTRYEAELKRRGSGIGAGASQPARSPWLSELDLGPQAAAAVACEREPGEVRRWRWP